MAIVILLAAGSGTRFDSSSPKQLIELGDKSLFEHAFTAFDNHPEIDEIVVVSSKQLLPELENLVNRCAKKTTHVVEGGQTRAASSYEGIRSLSTSENLKVLIHDAARPFVSGELITRCLSALDHFDAVSPTLPLDETIFELLDERVQTIPDRSTHRKVQTPQGFKLHTIKAAHEEFHKDQTFLPTDDCGIVLKYSPQTPIGVVNGDETNIKITHPTDMILARAIHYENTNS